MATFRALQEQHTILFEETLDKAATSLLIKHLDPHLIRPVLNRFEDLKRYNSVFYHKVVSIERKGASFLLVLLEKHLTHTEIRGRSTALARQETEELQEVEPVIIFRIPQPVGKAYIRKETLSDKLENVFSKADIDFKDYPGFSRNYHLTGDDPAAIRQNMPKQLIAALNNTPGITVEIAQDWAMLRSEKNLSEDMMLGLIGLGLKITKHQDVT